MKTPVEFIIIMLLLIISCSQHEKSATQTDVNTPDSNSLVADTIVYDVIIRNTDPYDEWANQRLQHLNHTKLIDSIFEMVYTEKVVAFDFFSGEPLKPSDIRSMESQQEFSRDIIGKMQFTERWYFDPSSARMQKEVLSVVLGYELYGDSGEFRGYKPIFKFSLNP